MSNSELLLQAKLKADTSMKYEDRLNYYRLRDWIAKLPNGLDPKLG